MTIPIVTDHADYPTCPRCGAIVECPEHDVTFSADETALIECDECGNWYACRRDITVSYTTLEE